MNNLESPTFIIILIALSNTFIMRILDKELRENNIKGQVYDLITIIVVLPAIPLIWIVFKDFDSQANNILTFYVPLIITISFLVSLSNRIIKYRKK